MIIDNLKVVQNTQAITNYQLRRLLVALTRFSYIRIDYYFLKSTIITTRIASEFKFLSGLLEKLKVSSKTLSAEELEDIGMSILMKRTARSKKVSRESIMRKLAS